MVDKSMFSFKSEPTLSLFQINICKFSKTTLNPDIFTLINQHLDTYQFKFPKMYLVYQDNYDYHIGVENNYNFSIEKCHTLLQHLIDIEWNTWDSFTSNKKHDLSFIIEKINLDYELKNEDKKIIHKI